MTTTPTTGSGGVRDRSAYDNLSMAATKVYHGWKHVEFAMSHHHRTIRQLGDRLDAASGKQQILTALGYGPDWLVSGRWQEPPQRVEHPVEAVPRLDGEPLPQINAAAAYEIWAPAILENPHPRVYLAAFGDVWDATDRIGEQSGTDDLLTAFHHPQRLNALPTPSGFTAGALKAAAADEHSGVRLIAHTNGYRVTVDPLAVEDEAGRPYFRQWDGYMFRAAMLPAVGSDGPPGSASRAVLLTPPELAELPDYALLQEATAEAERSGYATGDRTPVIGIWKEGTRPVGRDRRAVAYDYRNPIGPPPAYTAARTAWEELTPDDRRIYETWCHARAHYLRWIDLKTLGDDTAQLPERSQLFRALGYGPEWMTAGAAQAVQSSQRTRAGAGIDL